MGMSNSKQIHFSIQAQTAGTFSGTPPVLDLHGNVLTNNMSRLTFTNSLHISLLLFKHRKYQIVSLLNRQAVGHWG